jgi:PAS domain S-box-containing protein
VRSSHLFRRVFALLVVALILWMLMTSVLYAFVARPVFTNMKVRELSPRAESLAERAAIDFEGPDSLNAFVRDVVLYADEIYGYWMFLVDVDHNVLIHTRFPDELSDVRDEARKTVLAEVERFETSTESVLDTTGSFGKARSTYLVVSVPIRTEGRLAGCLSIVQPMAEMNAGILSLNIALFVSSLLVLIVMIIPVMFATIHLLRPMQSIRRVAVAMSRGDFSQRADESQPGEFQDLALAVNHLANELSTVISQLTVERNRLRQIIDGIAEGIIAVDENGLVTQFNTKVWEVFGVMTDITEPLSPDLFLQTTRLNTFFRDAITNKQNVSHVITKDHRQIACMITPLISEHDQVNGAVGLFRDITESERLEQTRRDYVANISHELRTPLTAMRGLLEPLAEDMVKSEADRKRYYAILLDETMRLSRLINDMLELSRLQATSSALRRHAVELADVVHTVVLRFGKRAGESRISLLTQADFERCPPVWSHRDRLEQILITLLDNAFKFTPEGGRITISFRAEDDFVDLSVRDTGIGIEPEDIDYVFDRFYKADKAHGEPGTGLGLSIASEIARQLGAKLSVRSEPGEGSIFTLRIPTVSTMLSAEEEVKEVFDASDQPAKRPAPETKKNSSLSKVQDDDGQVDDEQDDDETE